MLEGLFLAIDRSLAGCFPLLDVLMQTAFIHPTCSYPRSDKVQEITGVTGDVNSDLWSLISMLKVGYDVILHSTLTPIPPVSHLKNTVYWAMSSSEIIWHWCDLLYNASLLIFSISVNDANRSNSLSNSKAQALVSERVVLSVYWHSHMFTGKHWGDLPTLLCPLLDTVLLCLTSSDPFSSSMGGLSEEMLALLAFT